MAPDTRFLRAFTLIELLVVITIIVVLLALLAPALDQAIYRAELAACGAQQKSIALLVTAYASANKRHYPDRPTVNRLNLQPQSLRFDNGIDDRPILQSAGIAMDMLNDPLGPADIELDPRVTRPESRIQGGLNLWFDYGYVGERRMSRLGSFLTWTEVSSAGSRQYSFDVLSSDWDQINEPAQTIFANHNDRLGSMWPQVLQDQRAVEALPAAQVGNVQWTLSRWVNDGLQRRPLDMNFARADGSVQRLNELVQRDPRLVQVPSLRSGPNNVWMFIPPNR